MAGGDGYVIFKHRGNNPQDTGVLLTAALIDFLKKRGTVTGRILSGLQS
jgi:hypothetical protein